VIPRRRQAFFIDVGEIPSIIDALTSDMFAQRSRTSNVIYTGRASLACPGLRLGITVDTGSERITVDTGSQLSSLLLPADREWPAHPLPCTPVPKPDAVNLTPSCSRQSSNAPSKLDAETPIAERPAVIMRD